MQKYLWLHNPWQFITMPIFGYFSFKSIWQQVYQFRILHITKEWFFKNVYISTLTEPKMTYQLSK